MIGSLYSPGRSFLHRFDPRAKLLLALQLAAVFFLPLSHAHLAAYLGIVGLLVAAACGWRQALRPVRLLLPILLLVALLTPPFHRGGAVLLSVRGFVLLTSAGLLEAARLILRFTGITLALFGFLRTTDPDEIILCLRWFGLPFGLSLVLSVSLQYIPYLAALYGQVQEAHRLRRAAGLEGGGPQRRGPLPVKRPRGPRARLAARLPELTSVLILSVRRIPVLAMALETRGMGLRVRRSSYRSLKAGRDLLADAALFVAGTCALVVSAVMFR